MKYLIYALSVLLLLVVFTGCSDSGDSPTGNTNTGTTPTFSAVNLILSRSCSKSSTSCHGTSSASRFPMTNYAAIVNHTASSGTTVDSANGGGSNLYLKTTADYRFGSRMPLGGSALSSADQLLIKQWIDDGALNN